MDRAIGLYTWLNGMHMVGNVGTCEMGSWEIFCRLAGLLVRRGRVLC